MRAGSREYETIVQVVWDPDDEPGTITRDGRRWIVRTDRPLSVRLASRAGHAPTSTVWADCVAADDTDDMFRHRLTSGSALHDQATAVAVAATEGLYDHAVRLPPQLDLFRNANPVPHPPTIGFGDGDRWPVALTGWEQSDLRRQFDNADRALRDVIERCASALRDLHGRPRGDGSVTGLGNAAHSLIDAAAAVAALGKASDAAEHRHWTAGQPTCVDPATGTQYVGGDELPSTPDEGAAADGD